MLRIKNGVEIPCICVTNRKLCRGDFLERIRWIAGGGLADAILLREKDLPEEEYFSLAEKVMKICRDFSMPCILHSFSDVGEELGCRWMHIPLGMLGDQATRFERVGTSVHSVEQADLAASRGVGYMIAGHVFETDCKKGLPGRGQAFIRQVTETVELPVYGIGGINRENAAEVMEAGAAGVCIMSGFMLESKGHLC